MAPQSLVADFAAATVLPIVLLLLILQSSICVKAVDPNAPELIGYHTVKTSSGNVAGMFIRNRNPLKNADTRFYYHVSSVPTPLSDSAEMLYKEMEADSQKQLEVGGITMYGLYLNDESAKALLEYIRIALGSKKYSEKEGWVGTEKYTLLRFLFTPHNPDAQHLLAEHEVQLTGGQVVKFVRSQEPLFETPFYFYWVECVANPSPGSVRELFRMMTADAEEQLLTGGFTMAGVYLDEECDKPLLDSIKKHLATANKKFKEEEIETTESNKESFVVVTFPLAPPQPNAQELRTHEAVRDPTPGTSENRLLVTFGRRRGLPDAEKGINQEGYYYRVECYVEDPPAGTVAELLQRMDENMDKQMLVGRVNILGFYMDEKTASRLGAPQSFRDELEALVFGRLEEESVKALGVMYHVFKFPNRG